MKFIKKKEKKSENIRKLMNSTQSIDRLKKICAPCYFNI